MSGSSQQNSDKIQGEFDARKRQLSERSSIVLKKIKAAFIEAFTLKNVANLVIILAVCGICWQQCYIQVKEYLKYRTRIQVSHHYPSSTIWLSPGVTICNNNRLRFESLVEEVPGLKTKIVELSKNMSLEKRMDLKLINVLNPLKKIVDENLNISDMIINSPISKLMDSSRYRMIEDINCNIAWGKRINCENLRIVESFQDSPCYTVFHLGSLLEALATGDAYNFSKSLLGTNGPKLQSFDSHEIADILVNFDPIQHTDFFRDIGGKIVIHSTAHIGSLRDVAHSIVPGNKYDIIIKRIMSKRLPAPYESMCVDYKKANSKKFIEQRGSFASVELDRTTCIRNCIVKKTTKFCNCWPVEVPYFPNDETIVKNASSFKKCFWGDATILTNFSVNYYVNCYRKFHSECRDVCHHGCRTEDYKVHVLANPWPPPNRFFSANSDKERQNLYRLRGCCAMIAIKYLEFIETRRTQYPKVTLAQMVSNIGGIVSALVGVSTVTIYRYLTRRVFHCQIVNNNIKPESFVEPRVEQSSNEGGGGDDDDGNCENNGNNVKSIRRKYDRWHVTWGKLFSVKVHNESASDSVAGGGAKLNSRSSSS